MLPVYEPSSSYSSAAASSASALLMEYVNRMRLSHMDFEYAIWLMVNLCTSPRTAFRSTLYHSRTKHQWARDDPAFLVVLLYLLLVASAAWSFAFAQRTPAAVLGLFLYHAAVDLLLLGATLSTIGWWLANNYLHESQGAGDREPGHIGGWPATHAAPSTSRRHEAVEWLYAFDVHCNAFLPLYTLLHVAQYLLLPLLLRPGFLPAVLSNALYAVAFSAYHYLTFLGYSELPFLHRCECFVYPIALVLLAFVVSLPFNFNATETVARVYFGS